MRTSVIITNYNYGHFATEAIASALRQTIVPDEIVVVDDGSTDDSVEHLSGIYNDEPRVEIVSQSNGGMLSAHNRGFLESTGDIIFFLDADDLYEPGRIEAALRVFAAYPQAGSTFCPMRIFGNQAGFMFAWDRRDRWKTLGEDSPLFSSDIHFGKTLCDTYLLRRFVGGATSSLAFRRTTLEKFMPLNMESRWRTHSDNCLVYGAAMTGAEAHYTAEPLVLYRAHGNNDFLGKNQSKEKQAELEERNQAYIDWLAERFSLPPRHHAAILRQTAAILSGYPAPWKEYLRYARRLRSFGCRPTQAFLWRIRLLEAFMQGHLRGRSSAQPVLHPELKEARKPR